MTSVMISIKPKWCELIASGKKTIEVRKTRPREAVPFKCYIYETQGKTEIPWMDEDGHMIFKGRGQVIGEFVCDEIYAIDKDSVDWIYKKGNESIYAKEAKELCHCISDEELRSYLGHYIGYGWHISNLVIYDKPKYLSDFMGIKRSPQSWCYVWENPSL